MMVCSRLDGLGGTEMLVRAISGGRGVGLEDL